MVNLLLKGPAPAKEQTCFALWNLACQNTDNQVAIEQAGAIKPLVTLLSKGGSSLQEEAAGALMNLAAHPENKRIIAAAVQLPLCLHAFVHPRYVHAHQTTALRTDSSNTHWLFEFSHMKLPVPSLKLSANRPFVAAHLS